MAEKQNNKAFSSLMQYVILGVVSFFLFHLYDPRAIQESTMPWDYFLCYWFSRLIQLQLYLCSNYLFLILLSNVIICFLLVSSGLLSAPSKASEFCKAYGIESENLRVQIAAEPCSIEKKNSVQQHERQDEIYYINNECIGKGGKKSMFAENERACETYLTENLEEDSKREIYLTENLEEESNWHETVAVVPYQSTLAAHSDEELKRRCDEFIAKIRRQMSMQSG